MYRNKRADRHIGRDFPPGIVHAPIRTVPKLGNVYPARTAGAARTGHAIRSRRTLRDACDPTQPRTATELARSLRSLADPNTNASHSRSTEEPAVALAALPDDGVQPCARSYLRRWPS